MNRLLSVASLVALAAIATGLAGCGYNQSGSAKNRLEGGYTWNSLFREDVQTVAIPIFANSTFRRGYEFRLTEAVQKQLEAHAPYKVVARERADTVLEGQITDVRVMSASRDYRTNLPREQLMTITLDLVWKDLRSGQILMQRKGLTHEAVYYPLLGEGEFAGSQEAVEELARVIVEQLQADW